MTGSDELMQEVKLQKSQQFQRQTPRPGNAGLCLRCHQPPSALRSNVKIPSLVMQLLVMALIAMPASLQATAAQSTQWHPLLDIRETAASYISSRAQKPGQSTTVSAAELDNRLRLHRCGVALEAYLPPGGKMSANTTVGVKCASPRPWKLFVPVRVGVTARVLVAAKALSAGITLTDNDFIAEERDLGALHGGYLREGESVTGMVLRRRLPEGQPLRNEILKAPNAVRRGQQVTIRSGSREGPFNIRMAGTALSDGRIGQRILVKNRSSGRTIEGVIRSSEVVQIGN